MKYCLHFWIPRQIKYSTVGALAFWDNRACQHFASSDYFPQVRKMVRVTSAGDRPDYRSD